eukprot:Skav231338  [mRNA]  locus=scaffold2490:117442:119253:- [translate_table: standard]
MIALGSLSPGRGAWDPTTAERPGQVTAEQRWKSGNGGGWRVQLWMVFMSKCVILPVSQGRTCPIAAAAAMEAAIVAPSEHPPTMEQPMPRPMPEFVEVFEQMQALHLKLWEAHHAMLGGEGVVSLPLSCPLAKRGDESRNLSELSMELEEPGVKETRSTRTFLGGDEPGQATPRPVPGYLWIGWFAFPVPGE